MDIAIHNSKKKVSVSDDAFAASFNETLVHQLVVSYMASGRAGTKAQKTRSEVRGGGAKPWRQKGTGRARAGTIRSPIWRSGGVTFAATPRDYGKKLNKKMYRVGKQMLARLQELGVDDALVLTDGLDSAVYLAARNIPNIQVMDIAIVDPVSLVRQEKIVIDEAALKKLEERLS
jgi:large subunit ribosomal protein L4